MILMRQPGEREEVDLSAPPQLPAEPQPETPPEPLPAPVCPLGVVASELAEAEDEPQPEPGTSPIDVLTNGAGGQP